jgi:hypothetical protein
MRITDAINSVIRNHEIANKLIRKILMHNVLLILLFHMLLHVLPN